MKNPTVPSVFLVAGLVAGLVAMHALPAAALDKAPAHCASSKLKAAGKKALGKLLCEAKATKAATSVDSECMTKAEGKFDDAFAKAELKSDGTCIVAGDSATVETGVDAFVARMLAFQTSGGPFPDCTGEGAPCGTCGDGVCVTANGRPGCVSAGSVNDGMGCTSDVQCTTGEFCLSDTSAGSYCGAPCGAVEPVTLDKAARICAATKLKASGKKALGKLGCHAKAIKTNTNVDSECLTKADDKFGTAFDNAEKKGGCAFDGDAAPVESVVDVLVEDMVTQETVPLIPLPACSTIGAACGSCGDGTCGPHDPTPGCVSAGSAGPTPILCSTDAQCPRNSYCFVIVDVPPLPKISACLQPCP